LTHPKLSIVIPVYNEKDTIEKVIRKVLQVEIGLEKEIIVVDDGSQDGTRQILENLHQENIKTAFHSRNLGKGAALRTGFSHAQGDIIIIQDADLEYDPKDYPKLLDPILQDRADVVYGSRFLGGPHRVFLFWHYVGNKILTTLANMLANLNLNDMETCYKVFRREILDRINLKSKRFGFEPIIVRSSEGTNRNKNNILRLAESNGERFAFIISKNDWLFVPAKVEFCNKPPGH